MVHVIISIPSSNNKKKSIEHQSGCLLTTGFFFRIDVFFVCKYPMPQCNSEYINKYITILRFEIITRNSVFFSCTHYAWKEMKLPGETNSFLCYETTKKLCDEYNAIKVVEINFIRFLTRKWDIANRNGAYIIYRHEIVTE